MKDRKGISFTMTVIVSSLVILATALGVLALPQAFLPDFLSWIKGGTEGGIDDVKLQRMKSQCDLRKSRYCGSADPPDASSCPADIASSSLQNWACKVKVDGRWCYEYWQRSGTVTAVPACSP